METLSHLLPPREHYAFYTLCVLPTKICSVKLIHFNNSEIQPIKNEIKFGVPGSSFSAVDPAPKEVAVGSNRPATLFDLTAHF